jgi:hypothetical protein
MLKAVWLREEKFEFELEYRIADPLAEMDDQGQVWITVKIQGHRHRHVGGRYALWSSGQSGSGAIIALPCLNRG